MSDRLQLTRVPHKTAVKPTRNAPRQSKAAAQSETETSGNAQDPQFEQGDRVTESSVGERHGIGEPTDPGNRLEQMQAALNASPSAQRMKALQQIANSQPRSAIGDPIPVQKTDATNTAHPASDGLSEGDTTATSDFATSTPVAQLYPGGKKGKRKGHRKKRQRNRPRRRAQDNAETPEERALRRAENTRRRLETDALRDAMLAPIEAKEDLLNDAVEAMGWEGDNPLLSAGYHDAIRLIRSYNTDPAARDQANATVTGIQDQFAWQLDSSVMDMARAGNAPLVDGGVASDEIICVRTVAGDYLAYDSRAPGYCSHAFYVTWRDTERAAWRQAWALSHNDPRQAPDIKEMIIAMPIPHAAGHIAWLLTQVGLVIKFGYDNRAHLNVANFQEVLLTWFHLQGVVTTCPQAVNVLALGIIANNADARALLGTPQIPDIAALTAINATGNFANTAEVQRVMAWGGDIIANERLETVVALTAAEITNWNGRVGARARELYNSLLLNIGAVADRANLIRSFLRAPRATAGNFASLLGQNANLNNKNAVPMATLCTLLRCGLIRRASCNSYMTNFGKGVTWIFMYANGGRLDPEWHVHFRASGRRTLVVGAGWKYRGEKYALGVRANGPSEPLASTLTEVYDARWIPRI